MSLWSTPGSRRPVQGLHGMRPGWLHMADMRNLLPNIIEIIQGQGDTGLGRDGHQVEDGIGRTTKSHINPDGVVEALLCDDIPREGIIPD